MITQQGLHFWFTRLAVHSWCWALFWRHSLMLPADGFYTYPTFSCFSYHWNKIFRVIDEYIMRTMKSYCGVIVDALSTRTSFFWYNLWRSYLMSKRTYIFHWDGDPIVEASATFLIGTRYRWYRQRSQLCILITPQYLRNSPYNCVRWTKPMGLLRRKRTSKEIIIHTVTLQLTLSREYIHLI